MAQSETASRSIKDVIYREVTPGMISAGLDVLEESADALNSGELPAPDFVARVFAAMRCAQ